MSDDIESAGSSDPHMTVWGRLEEQRKWYAAKSRKARGMYLRVKLGQIVVGAGVPVLAGVGAPALVTATIAASVVVAEGAQQLFQWHVNWLSYRATAEELKRESFLYLAEADPYSGADRHKVLALRMEAVIRRENDEWSVQSKNPQPQSNLDA
ncbi:DUF4231 domain-containing protein [Nocardia sp. NBC_01377]|uniref:DUF4231 domain-containing protein n=1 Tax=Nocardia sp. NBC_01377 TaxID=2903595 RepID=UPI0038679E5D